ncbi:MAG TPA: hypothetical protein ENJ38_11085 [Rhodospirillales bacterium]|nr:hypothetical protein [Rhodospirillales bacterium]
MKNRFQEVFRYLRLIWQRWPRRFVLRESGTPVELLQIEEKDGVRRYLVELPSGRRELVAEGALTSRLAHAGVAVATLAAVALAGLVAGASLLPDLQAAMLRLKGACEALGEVAPTGR